MALTPQIQSSQARLLAATRAIAGEVRGSQARVMTAVNFPTEDIRSSQARVLAAVHAHNDMLVTQGRLLVAVRGHVQNPKLNAWTYSLDGHDYYILRLGETKTLVFDLTTKQWSWFSSMGRDTWRPNCGFNWRSGGQNPKIYGSNVVVGDDTHGLLWILDPLEGVDQNITSEQADLPFERVATGQIAARDRNIVPIYSVYLTASLGKPAVVANTVTLEYSDDQGHTYISADEPMVAVQGDYAQEFSWLSMGQVRAPGRLFRITDNGAFARIDSLDVND